MITKAAFFAMLNDKENRVGVTAHIATFEEANGFVSVIVKQQSAPNFGLSMHRLDAAAQAAFTKYNTWLNEWLAAQAEAARAHAEALEMNIQISNQKIVADAYRQPVNKHLVELDHAEALEIDRAYNYQLSFYCFTERFQQVFIKHAHEDALRMDVIHDKAVLLVATHITLPVWERSSDALKFQLRKLWGDNAPAYAKEDGGRAHV